MKAWSSAIGLACTFGADSPDVVDTSCACAITVTFHPDADALARQLVALPADGYEAFVR